MDRIESLLKYDRWANHKVLNALSEQDAPQHCPGAIKHIAHLLKAQKIWADRIKSLPADKEIWPSLSLNECKQLQSDYHETLMSLIPERQKIIQYQNSKGQSFSNTVEDILHHLVIHGQHHRAQIALLMRQAGLTPPVTDYIFYLREKK